ncbi:MAG: D-alanine--D-alanine ligase family protein [Pseudomonadota bacterium]
MPTPLRVAVLFGGKSGEHEVSCTSSRAVIQALQSMPEHYTVVPVGITRHGRWVSGGEDLLELLRQTEGYKPLPDTARALPTVYPDPAGGAFISVDSSGKVERIEIDAVFPVLHGPNGEDGTVQGLLEVADVPYVGCGVLASSLAMDKVVAKAVFHAAGLPVMPWVDFLGPQWRGDEKTWSERVEKELGYPCFVKPANMGSSVGITKVHERSELGPAVVEALRHDRKVLVEKAATEIHEIECAVLGNDSPEASVPGEIVPCKEFYDYEAKYLADGSKILIPAPIAADKIARVRDLAVKAFRAVDGSGMARVDFFVDKAGDGIWLNEINTIPGFTPISMYPKMWQASGISFNGLVHRLIQLAIERHQVRAHS